MFGIPVTVRISSPIRGRSKSPAAGQTCGSRVDGTARSPRSATPVTGLLFAADRTRPTLRYGGMPGRRRHCAAGQRRPGAPGIYLYLSFLFPDRVTKPAINRASVDGVSVTRPAQLRA
jgi:hypothetical protein